MTIDAMGRQTEIAGEIAQKGGDYVPAVKDNQPTLHEALRRNLDEMILEKFKGVRHVFVQTIDGDHGRVETRRVWETDQLDDWLDARQRQRRAGGRLPFQISANEFQLRRRGDQIQRGKSAARPVAGVNLCSSSSGAIVRHVTF